MHVCSTDIYNPLTRYCSYLSPHYYRKCGYFQAYQSTFNLQTCTYMDLIWRKRACAIQNTHGQHFAGV